VVRLWLVFTILFLLNTPAWGEMGDEVINRPMQTSSSSQFVHQPITFSPHGMPSEFTPRDFPSVIRDPRLPDAPDGVLWRRILEENPGLDPVALLSQSPSELKNWLAKAANGDPDTVHVLVMRVDFLLDSAGDQSTTETGAFDLRHPDSARVPIDPPPHNKDHYNAHMEAMRRYYDKQTNGALVLTWDIYPAESDSAYHLSDTGDYGPWWMSGFDIDVLELAERFVNDTFAAVETDDRPPDFRQYDSFVIIHSGPDFQGDINRNTPFDIPSFNVQLAEPVAVQDSTHFIYLIDVMPEHVNQDGFLGAINAVLTHEFGHQLGFYDMYNVYNFVPQVGMFSLMDSGDNLYGSVWDEYREEEVFVRGAIPASVDPWQKMIFFPQGITPHWIKEDQELELPVVQLHNDLALVPIGGQGIGESGSEPDGHLIGSEYFIVETRPYDINGDLTVYLKADSLTGVIMGPRNVPIEDTDEQGLPADTLGRFEQDYLLPGEGILIWHVDNVAIRDAARQCNGCLNIFNDHRAVDVEEADGIQDLGDIYSVQWTGGMHDYWIRGQYNYFGPNTYPSTAAAGGAGSGISIDVLDSTLVTLSNGEPGMRIKFERGYTHEGWPRYAGYPVGNESIIPFHLDRDGIHELASTAGQFLQMFKSDNSYSGVIAAADSLLHSGVAMGVIYDDEVRMGRNVAAVASNTKVYLTGMPSTTQWVGDEILTYPGGDQVFPSLRFSTAPMLLDSVLVVGDSEGRVRGLIPGHSPVMAWITAKPGFEVTTIAAGRILENDQLALVWGNSAGDIYLATGSQRTGFELASNWPVRIGDGSQPITWLHLVEGEKENSLGQIFAANGSGRVVCLTPEGDSQTGWPADTGGPLAGPLAIGDPDGDGKLELVATRRNGDVYVIDDMGRIETTWPRSVWHPDVEWRTSLRCGACLVDMAGDERPEIVQGGGYGALHVLMWDGGEAPGWPRIAGYDIASGPVVGTVGDESGEIELITVDREGFITLVKTGLERRDSRPGEMWNSTDTNRMHSMAREALPSAPVTVGLLASEKMIFAPHPLEGGEGELILDANNVDGSVMIRLFDTSGQEVERMEYELENRIPVDFRHLAAGLYIARITIAGDGEEVTKLKKIAIIN
jgi:M6 family metalloprotease-like protein